MLALCGLEESRVRGSHGGALGPQFPNGFQYQLWDRIDRGAKITITITIIINIPECHSQRFSFMGLGGAWTPVYLVPLPHDSIQNIHWGDAHP